MYMHTHTHTHNAHTNTRASAHAQIESMCATNNMITTSLLKHSEQESFSAIPDCMKLRSDPRHGPNTISGHV